MAEVVLKNVSKVYPNGVRAVNNINLHIKDKEFLVLVGPSGCGKSTILRMIAGLEEVSSGEIYIGERLVNNVPPKDRNIAMVFQNYALYPHMTVRQNLAFGLKLHKHPPEVIEERIKKTAEILGIFDLLDRKPRALSGGQRQRAALGRAIVRQPLVFLFDEPLSNLDAKFRVQMRAEIKKLHQQLKTTMIYVTHDQVEAMTMGERIAVIKAGTIQQISTPAFLYHNPVNKFVAGFIGSPSMNFFEGRVVEEKDKLYFQGERIVLEVARMHTDKLRKVKGKDLILGIRPENIHLAQQAISSASSEVKGCIVRARLEIIEMMGAVTYLSFTLGGVNFNARVESSEMEGKENRPRIGEEIDLVFNSEKCHYFEKESEQAIL